MGSAGGLAAGGLHATRKKSATRSPALPRRSASQGYARHRLGQHDQRVLRLQKRIAYAPSDESKMLARRLIHGIIESSVQFMQRANLFCHKGSRTFFELSILMLALVTAPAFAQRGARGGAPALPQNLAFRFMGPAVGNRIAAAAGVPSDPTVYYAGAASGGVWKSTDSGRTWA